MSSMPAARNASTAYAISGRLQTGTIGFGSVLVTGRSRVPRPAARIMLRIEGDRVSWRAKSSHTPPNFGRGSLDCARDDTVSRDDTGSQGVRWKDHVFGQIGARASRQPVEIGVRLTESLIEVHPELRGDGADDIHRSFDLEVITDRRAVEDDFDVADAPHLAELLVAEDRLESERIEELDGELERLDAGLHFLARLHAAVEHRRTFVCRDGVAAELADAEQRAARAQLPAAVEHDVVFERFGIEALCAEVRQFAD